jgi:hypothetical protein
VGIGSPLFLYIQKSDLPIILTHASDGVYRAAMQSVEDMQEFIDVLIYQFDEAANMDW